MSELKVGTKIRIKTGLADGEFYDGCDIVPDMVSLCGSESLISDIFEYFVTLDIDSGKYCWTPEMFDVIE